jgi:hypothetical protein
MLRPAVGSVQHSIGSFLTSAINQLLNSSPAGPTSRTQINRRLTITLRVTLFEQRFCRIFFSVIRHPAGVGCSTDAMNSITMHGLWTLLTYRSALLNSTPMLRRIQMTRYGDAAFIDGLASSCRCVARF